MNGGCKENLCVLLRMYIFCTNMYQFEVYEKLFDSCSQFVSKRVKYVHLRSHILLHLTKSVLLQMRLEPLPQSDTHFDTHGPIVDPCQNCVSALSTFLRIDQ